MASARPLLLLFLLGCAIPAKGYEACGELRNAFGPYDYRTTPADTKEKVEAYHFAGNVETLQSGQTGTVGGDIDYTLRAFPNHPRALLAMLKLSMKTGTDKPPGAKWSVECYFDRALRFAPDDPTVHMLYGIYLTKHGNMEAAKRELDQARKNDNTDANLSYNLGLAYFDVKEYDKALEQAKTAYALGFPLPGLRDKLKRVGKWSNQ